MKDRFWFNSNLPRWLYRFALIVSALGLLAGLNLAYVELLESRWSAAAGSGALCLTSLVFAVVVIAGRRFSRRYHELSRRLGKCDRDIRSLSRAILVCSTQLESLAVREERLVSGTMPAADQKSEHNRTIHSDAAAAELPVGFPDNPLGADCPSDSDLRELTLCFASAIRQRQWSSALKLARQIQKEFPSSTVAQDLEGIEPRIARKIELHGPSESQDLRGVLDADLEEAELVSECR